MPRIRRSLLLATVALAVACATAATVHADGLPVLGIDVGPTGIGTQDAGSRYVTLPGGAGTVVARVAQDGGQVLASRALSGRFTIPAVAYDGSASGLSADGATLVLISPRVGFPRARTGLIALDTHGFRTRTVIELAGDFSFDAISPDGTRIYLIRYLSPADPTRYQVRAYDLGAGRLLPDPIVDPGEPGEPMRGRPVSRLVSPDGRFAYTLYDRPAGVPFVHVLDTAAGRARCVDLTVLTGHPASAMRLSANADGTTLTVLDRGAPVAEIDTTSYHVAPAATSATDTRDRHRVRLPIVLGLGALLAVGAAVVLARRHRRVAPARVEPGGDSSH